MTADEQEYVAHLEALVKRYRKRIIELKNALQQILVVTGQTAPGELPKRP